MVWMLRKEPGVLAKVTRKADLPWQGAAVG